MIQPHRGKELQDIYSFEEPEKENEEIPKWIIDFGLIGGLIGGIVWLAILLLS